MQGEGDGSHSSPLAWKIPWTEEPGGLQSMGLRRVGHDWVTSLSLFTFTFHFHFSLSCTGAGNGNPLQCSCLENPRDGRAWWAAVHGVAQSWTRLKRLSSSSNSYRLGKWPQIRSRGSFMSQNQVRTLFPGLCMLMFKSGPSWLTLMASGYQYPLRLHNKQR